MDDPRQSEDRFQQEFGRAIELERLRRGWTADEAARRAAVAPKTWQRLEDGLPVRKLTLLKVDQLFGLPSGTALTIWQEQGDLATAFGRATSSVIDDHHDDGDENATGTPIDSLLEHLPELTMDELDVVITSAQATQRVKAAEQRRHVGLPEPQELTTELGFDDNTAPLPGPPDEPQAPPWTAFYAAQHAVWVYQESYDRAGRAWHRMNETRGSGYHETAAAEFTLAVESARDAASELSDKIRSYLSQLDDDDLAVHSTFWRAKRKLDDAQREYQMAGQDINSALKEMRGGA
jgi:hypothetical protein